MVSQSAALEETLSALGTRVKPEHAALLAAARGLAEAVDALPTRATLWTEYRAVLATLYETAGEVADDGQAALLKLVSTPLGDTKKPRAKNARAGGSGDRKRARPAVDAVATAGS